MIYALRKLIAFVFLGGIFWFIYQDLDNLEQPWFMHALGMIAVAFAFFWLLIPMLVVWVRRKRRLRRNRARYEAWLAEGGAGAIRPRSATRGKTAQVASIAKGALVYFHEKGTLYTDVSADGTGTPRHPGRGVGRPSDVAFPRFRRKCRIDQRIHCYFTGDAVVFVGRDLDCSIPLAELESFATEPGGIVFTARRGASGAQFAFTFQNPLIAADVLEHVRGGGK